ncbi:hypothetical protein ACH4TU_30595 [Streptomyces physcomitrii]
MTQTPAAARALRVPGYRARGRRRAGRDLWWLAGVCAAYTLAQLAFVAPGSGLGWDETVYVSQVSPDAATAFFSAPRARGITYLAAPVTLWTSSVPLLRLYLAVLSGAALLGALLIWRRLLPPPVPALAGALFGSLWITLFYGPQVMPNLWVALGALAATGCFLRAARDPRDRAALAGLGAALALVALMRPSDALWLGLPLALAALCVRPWRRPLLLLALAAGAALGSAPWVIEAYTAYGGLGTRLERASEIQGHLRPHLAFGHQLRSLGGRALCRPCGGPWKQPVTGVWWLLLPPLVLAGAVMAARRRLTAPVLLATLTGLSLAVPYLFFIGYAAARFLLPAYALLAIPVALCLAGLARRARARTLTALALALLLAGHLAIQSAVLHSAADRVRTMRTALGDTAAELRRQGLRPPCVVSGEEAVRIAYRTGCASRQTSGHDRSTSEAAMRRLARARPVAVILNAGATPPGYARTWRTHRLPALTGLDAPRAFLSPSAGAAGPGSGEAPAGPRER